MSRVLCSARQIAGHFRDESFEAITYTGTDKYAQNKWEKIRQKHTKRNHKTNSLDSAAFANFSQLNLHSTASCDKSRKIHSHKYTLLSTSIKWLN